MLKQAYKHVCQWNVDDKIQRKKILCTKKELLTIIENKNNFLHLENEFPFQQFIHFYRDVSTETMGFRTAS